MQIQLFITGGTLDKNYNPLTGELVFSHSHLAEMLTQANCTLNPNIHTLMLKDSLDMTDADRQTIADACLASPAKHFVITHGTDTLVETAKTLLKQPGLVNKTLVLTGAMRPFKLGESDALFNLGSALTACQLLSPGVYVCMNGKILPGNQAFKNKTLGQFEALSNHTQI